MQKAVMIVLALAILSGCVSTKNIPIPKDAIPEEPTHSVIISEREIPDFAAQTAGAASFGLLGALAMISEGNNLIEEHDVEDPASYIGNEVLKALATKYKIELLSDNIPLVDDEDPESIAQLYKEAGYVLDLRTINWSFGYFPTDWNNYRVIYSAKLRIIKTATSEVLAEGFCSRIPEQDETSPSYDELLANNAERLKSELIVAADYCIDHFIKETLDITAKETEEPEEKTAAQNQ